MLTLLQALYVQISPETSDSRKHLGIAVNLVENGVYYPNPGTATPYSRREPVLPFFVAGFIEAGYALGVERIDQNCVLFPAAGNPECIEQYAWTKYALLPFLIGSALGVFQFVRAAGGSFAMAMLGLVLCGLSGSLTSHSSRLLQEVPSAFFLIWASVFVLSWLNTKRHRYAVLLGLTLGLLTLTKVTFVYLIFALLLCAGWVAFTDKEARQRLAVGGVVVLIGFSAVTSVWMIRNHEIGQGFKLTNGRVGPALLIRTSYNRMTADEFLLGFLYWTPGVGHRVLTGLDIDPERYRKLDRSHSDSYYHSFKSLLGEAVANTMPRTSERGSQVTRFAIDELLDRPFIHIRNSVLFAYRGIFAERHLGFETPQETFGERLGIPTPDVSSRILGLLLSSFGFLALLVLTVIALRRRNFALFAALIPALYLHFLLAGLSHFIPRYAEPEIPIRIAALMILIPLVIGYLRNRRPQSE